MLKQMTENMPSPSYAVETVSAGVVQERLKKVIQYRDAMGLANEWSLNENFRNGDQWPPVVPLTQNLPRPVFNMIKYIENHKVSSLLSEQVRMVFSNLEELQDGEADWGDIFTRITEATWEEIKQDQLNMKALYQAVNKGLGIWHYYWNSGYTSTRNSAKGKVTGKGRMEGETLDIMNVFFGDPQNLYVQSQPYIIILKREAVSRIKAIAKANKVSPEDIERINADKDTKDNRYSAAQQEVENQDGKANLLVMYTKINGIIYYQMVCNNVIVQPMTSTKKKLYPIAIMAWEERKECIYGMSDTRGLIANQRVINMLLAMQVMSVQLTGFPKMMYKKGFVDPGKIRNMLGEMIEDLNPSGQWSAQYLIPGQISPVARELVDNFLNMTKDLAGAHETVTGEAAPSNATAISLMQRASSVSLDAIKKRYFQAIEDIGRIWEEFYKVNYNMDRIINIKDDDGEAQPILFNGANAADSELNLKIDIGTSTLYGEDYSMLSLDKFLEAGFIDFKTYLKYAPKNRVPFKDSLLKDMELQEKQQAAQTMDQLISTMTPQERQIFDASDENTRNKMLYDMANSQQQMMQQQAMMPQQPNINKQTA